ncbi:MAG TPA: DUF1275 domain-containing protein [Candidatus Egerieimonas intestinavium]|uniref:DUF1275 domain-containing protein n=1 Tax=Candidatus Egerieimonas intestinavium TaxID=2840777 RepID=A0A9D1EJN0_9FIRM|nr:DUF1275 domain-containing protein [Candidatus Egerieimonas intestinavium]
MNVSRKTETAAHHAMAVVGGFFGVYALLTRSETFGSSETSNLIHLILSGLNGSTEDFLIRLGATLCYIGGIVFATLMPKFMRKGAFRYWAIAVDGAACVGLAWIPADVSPVLALYPMFFATAVQWLAYSQADGFSSATIFSTNNLRQCFAGLAEFLYGRERKHLEQFCFFAGTLICFHLGVLLGFFSMKAWGIRSIYACIPLLVIGFAVTRWDDKRKLGEKI